MTRLYAEGAPIQVEADPAGAPLRFMWGDRWRAVVHIANRWRTNSTWWNSEAAVNREYYKLIDGENMLCIIFRERDTGVWMMHRIYD